MENPVYRDEEGNIKVDVSKSWKMYESIFSSCESVEEINYVMSRLDMLDLMIADIRATTLQNKKVS